MISKPLEETRISDTDVRPLWWQDLDTGEFSWHIPDKFNIAQACVDQHEPGNLALIVDDGEQSAKYSYGDVASRSRKVATVLKGLGLAAGDRVAIMVPQGIEVLTAHLGAFRAGMVTVPLSVKFGADAIGHRLQDSQARVLIMDAVGFARIKDDLASLAKLDAVLLVGESPFDDVAAGTHSFGQLVDEAIEDPHTAPTGPTSHAIIIYTSGTTGNPKGALHGHQILLAHMPGVRIAFDDAPQPDDVFWTPADWAWIGGLFDVLFPALAMGCPVVATPDKFTPARALEVLRRHQITASFIPPTALKHLRSAGVDSGAAEGVRLRALGTGGESLGESLQGWVHDTFGVAINEFYGQTEMNMTVGTSRSNWTAKPGSMGRAFPCFKVALLSPTGQEVATGDVGEICVAAGNPGQFLGYWRQPDQTHNKVRGGWIHTGDLALADDEGNLWYQGRADDVISSAGYRIGPGEIEECLLSHTAVAMAGVIGMPDDLRGEAVHAFVVLNESALPSEELRTELQNHVKSHLAFYQYPRAINFIDHMPLTTTGKILRRELRRLDDGVAQR